MKFLAQALALAAATLLPCPATEASGVAERVQAFMQGERSLLFGRLVHNMDARSEGEGGHFELYVHAAMLAPAYEIRFRLAEAGEAAALRDALARHRAGKRRGSFFVLLAHAPAALIPASADMAELRGVRAADILPLPGGTEELQALLDELPELNTKLPRQDGTQGSWDWD